MKQTIPPSTLIYNADGSIYHLNLHREQVAPVLLLVGDPDRVPRVSKYFDKIDFKIQKREFVTHTGWLGGRRLSVISTGIGTDNIDIVLNELDALFNIDPATRQVKDELVQLDFIRIGTSGVFSKEIPVDSMVASVYGIGLDCLLRYYEFRPNASEKALATGFNDLAKNHGLPLTAIAVAGSPGLLEEVAANMHRGITLSCPGFYGPQGRSLRLPSVLRSSFFPAAGSFRFDGVPLTNFEMETSAIYGLSRLLGHRALSCNALIANRITNQFSKDPKATVERLIREVLEKLSPK
ncbi:MAG TPA: phosphorylase [Bacteroidetes bacterium]|nr:phosphorylase [Bacteroidota bacterium]